MKKIKMMLVVAFSLFTFNVVAMAQCSTDSNGAKYSIEVSDGTKYCATLSEAFTDVKDTGTITLLDNDTLSQGVVLRESKNVTIDLAGKTISGNIAANGYVLAMLNANITITDSATGGKIANTSTGAAFIAASGTLNLNGGTLESNGVTAAVQVGQTTTTGTMIINGGTIENKNIVAGENNSVPGFALYVINGTATLNNGLVKSSTSNTVAIGSVELDDSSTTGSLIVNDGTIQNVSTTGTGLAIIITKGDVDINNGLVTSNSGPSTIQVGAPDVPNKSKGSDDVTFTIDDGKVENTGTGAAILIARGTATINKGEIVSNGLSATIQVGNSKDYSAHLIVNDGNIEHKKNVPALIVPYGNSDATINGGNIKINEDDTTSTNDTAIMIGMNPSDSDKETGKDYGSGAKVIVNDGNITGGIALFGNQPELSITGGNITARSFAVSGNGSPEGSVNATINSKIIISGGNLTSTENAAIYHPQNGSLTISDGTISGKIGIVARQGDIVITGGTITATGSADEKVRVGDAKEGNDYVQLPTGTAIIVDNSEDAYSDDANVNITGGTVTGESQSILSYDEDTVNDFTITGGTFLSNGVKDPIEDYLPTNGKYGQAESGLVGIVHNINKENVDSTKGSVESFNNATEGEKVEFTIETTSSDYEVDEVTITFGEETVEYTVINGVYSFVMPAGDVTIDVTFKNVYADYTELDEAIESAEEVDQTKYTEESVKALNEALNKAKELEKDLMLSEQAKVDEIVKSLNEAISNLVVKPVEEEKVPNTYDVGMSYMGLALLSLGTMIVSIRKLRNN